MARTDVDVVVVGAGFAGMYALHLLREKGFTCHSFEAAQDVGGTWYWNRYPGARCDVESLDYCYSFSEEIHREWDWSERYATQPEILRYAEFVADRLNLRPLISFGAQVASVIWDETTATWLVSTKDGRQQRSRFVVTGVGLLSASNTPSIPGLDRFAGRILHTGHWPHEGVDLTGQRVAVIGTGSSGIQVIPSIAEQVDHLTVFQRTPNFSIPARNRPLTAREIQRSKGDREFIRGQAFASPAGYYSRRATKSIFDDSPEDRRQTLERRWQIGGFEFLGAYTDPMVTQEANDLLADFVRDKIAEAVQDPETVAKLQPRSHPIMSKRPTVNTAYYETFNRPNVELVDLTADPLVEITEKGVRTESGEYEVDVLVMATGYDAVTGPLVRLGIEGRDGVKLADEWADGARSYLGLAMAGFPNLFTITGPLSATPLTNVVRSIEHHVEWIVSCLEHLRTTGATTIEASPEAQEDWDRQIAHVGTFTLHAGTASWYTGGNIEGKARKLMAWVGGLDRYAAVCQKVADDGYTGFEVSDATAPAAVATSVS